MVLSFFRSSNLKQCFNTPLLKPDKCPGIKETSEGKSLLKPHTIAQLHVAKSKNRTIDLPYQQTSEKLR